MEEIIKIQKQDGKDLVSARELHSFLEIGKGFSAWCKLMFSYGFTENVDYTRVSFSFSGQRDNQVFANPNPKIDYALTIDTAKHISMIQRNEKGMAARNYFIAVEKKLSEPAFSCPEEMMVHQAQLMLDQKRKLESMDSRITLIEAKAKTRPDYMTVIAYATIHNVRGVGLALASKIGGRAIRMCKSLGYSIDNVFDPRFGMVNCYPEEILRQVFAEN